MQKASRIFSFTCVSVSVSMARTLSESMPQPWKDTFRFCTRGGRGQQVPTITALGPGGATAEPPGILDPSPSQPGRWSLLAALLPLPRQAHPGLGLDVLPQQPLLVERVARLACDGIDGALVDLLLDGAQEQEERLPDRLLGWTQAVGAEAQPAQPRPHHLPACPHFSPQALAVLWPPCGMLPRLASPSMATRLLTSLLDLVPSHVPLALQVSPWTL